MPTGNKPYVGRFAPSPTGELHFGSLIAAVGSFLQARCNDGLWLIRVEDIDPPREVAGSAERILYDLAQLGMEPDRPVIFQADRLEAYREACEQLLRDGSAFHCGCSRSDLPAGGPYPGTCRDSIPKGRHPRSIRARVEPGELAFHDAVQGDIKQDLAACAGDFVIRRADGLPAYQLAVVVDDAWQGVTEVVRGADLLDSTPRQIHLQGLLGLPRPEYMHLPLAQSADGRKLSKRLGSDPLSSVEPVESLRQALHFLGQEPPGTTSLGELWAWSFDNWRPDTVPRGPVAV